MFFVVVMSTVSFRIKRTWMWWMLEFTTRSCFCGEYQNWPLENYFHGEFQNSPLELYFRGEFLNSPRIYFQVVNFKTHYLHVRYKDTKTVAIWGANCEVGESLTHQKASQFSPSLGKKSILNLKRLCVHFVFERRMKIWLVVS